jgi:hypothetical protein
VDEGQRGRLRRRYEDPAHRQHGKRQGTSQVRLPLTVITSEVSCYQGTTHQLQATAQAARAKCLYARDVDAQKYDVKLGVRFVPWSRL